MKKKTNPVLYIWIFCLFDDEPADFCNDHWIKSRGQSQKLFMINTRKKTTFTVTFPLRSVFTALIKTQTSALHYHVNNNYIRHSVVQSLITHNHNSFQHISITADDINLILVKNLSISSSCMDSNEHINNRTTLTLLLDLNLHDVVWFIDHIYIKKHLCKHFQHILKTVHESNTEDLFLVLFTF